MRASVTLETALRQDRVFVAVSLGLVAVLAWAYVLWFAAAAATGEEMAMSGGMDAMLAPAFREWTLADFGVMAAMWATMMVGMMTPTVAPMVLLYAQVGRKAAATGKRLAATGSFFAGYLISWTGFALVATALQWALERTALIMPMGAGAPVVLGGMVLIAAGLYQWTPLKASCLSLCQAPIVFIQRHGGFRPGLFASTGLGMQHGLYCIGCCWALMGLLFAGGIMNMLWIAGIVAIVLAEKLVPASFRLSRVVGAVLTASGVLMLVGLATGG